jgi:hypothetical protein
MDPSSWGTCRVAREEVTAWLKQEEIAMSDPTKAARAVKKAAQSVGVAQPDALRRRQEGTHSLDPVLS